jgi:hypothetical protein
VESEINARLAQVLLNKTIAFFLTHKDLTIPTHISYTEKGRTAMSYYNVSEIAFNAAFISDFKTVLKLPHLSRPRTLDLSDTSIT